MAKQNTRQVSIFINGKEVENTIKSIAAEQAKLNNSLRTMVRGTDEYEAKVLELRRVNGILKEHNDGLRGIKQGWDLNKIGVDKFIGVAAGAFTVDAIIGYGKELFNTALKMEALDKKARIVFGETLPSVTEEAKKDALQMGLTTAQYVSQAAAIQDILVPMGFQRKQAAEISTQLINLSGALAEWTGNQVSASEVSDILSSALTGERERLKQLGIVLQQADIDARVAEKGMGKLEGTLKQQAEAAATLELVLEKSQDAQTAYANNADSMTRRTAELSAQLEDIKERISNSLVPVFEALVSVTDKTLDGIERITTAINNTTWGDRLKEILGPLLGLGGAVIGGGNIVRRIFGTKNEVSAAQAEVDKLVADTDALLKKYGVDKNQQSPATSPGETPEEKKKREAAEKKAKEEAARLQKDLSDLVEFTSMRRRDLLAKEQEDELGIVINGIEDRYNKEIAKAIELEKKGVTEATAQRITLEQLKQQEIGDAVTAYTEKSIEEAQKQAYDKAKAVAQAEADAARESQDFLDQRQKEREDAQKQIEEFKLAAVEDARAVEIQKLQEHYNELLKVAEDYGIDTTGLKEAQEKQLAEITKKYAEDEAKKQYETNQKRLEALSGLFSNFGNLVSSTFDLLGAEGEKSAAFQKVATLAKIAFDTASAISSLVAASEANPANAVTFGAAAIAQYVSGIARIISNIAQAKKVLSAAPTVKQKASGRYLTVTGDADGRQYNASVIPTPYTGLLPNHPVLFQSQATGQPVLASERGAEYFVSAEALRNPYVANLTRMIDNISMAGRGVPQFADGGVNTATSTAATTPAGIDPALVANLNSAITTLNSLLSRGIVAVIPDQTLTNIPKRLGKINDASGGYFG